MSLCKIFFSPIITPVKWNIFQKNFWRKLYINWRKRGPQSEFLVVLHVSRVKEAKCCTNRKCFKYTLINLVWKERHQKCVLKCSTLVNDSVIWGHTNLCILCDYSKVVKPRHHKLKPGTLFSIHLNNLCVLLTYMYYTAITKWWLDFSPFLFSDHCHSGSWYVWSLGNTLCQE
jgi:hypothetical protein